MHQYIKEYKVGHRARKRDQNAWASFVLIMGVGLMIASERINSQLSLSHEKAIASVDHGGEIDAPRDIPCVARVGH